MHGHFGVRHFYNARGHLAKVADAQVRNGVSKTTYVAVEQTDAAGRVIKEQLGEGGLTRIHTHDGQTGRLRGILTQKLGGEKLQNLTILIAGATPWGFTSASSASSPSPPFGGTLNQGLVMGLQDCMGGTLRNGRYGHSFPSARTGGFFGGPLGSWIGFTLGDRSASITQAVLAFQTATQQTGGKFASGASSETFSNAPVPEGVPTYEGPAEPDSWQWPVFPGGHYYEVLSARTCAVSECDYKKVIKVLNEKAVHREQVERFDPDSKVIHEADVDLPIPFSGRDTVRVEALTADNGLQIGVLNTALEDHGLYPGTVTRKVVVYKGYYHIHTVGRGDVWLGRQNVVRKEEGWGKLDQLVIDEF